MNRRKIGWWVCCGLGFAALHSAAASNEAPSGEASAKPGIAGAMIVADAATHPDTADKSASAPSGRANGTQEPASNGVRKSRRLRFRGPDGTCACDCASGGISEADIRKAEEARRSASR